LSDIKNGLAIVLESGGCPSFSTGFGVSERPSQEALP
jgi:hypothetical protein